jgi:hypothetical protein
MSESASGTMTTTPLAGGLFQYTITLTNTSASTPIGSFWFAWDDAPINGNVDANFLIDPPDPGHITEPTGWTVLRGDQGENARRSG